MALSQTEPMNSLPTDALIGERFQLTLQKSVEDLLAEIQGGGSNFSRFIDVFYNLMQAKIDPPIESIWVYAALSFRIKITAIEDPLDRVASTKDMLQFISYCSGSSSPSKSIGLLAPIVFEVYKLVNLLLSKDSYSKKEKKAMREVKSLIDSMLGYISTISCNDLSEGDTEATDSSLRISVSDLVHVWTDSSTDFGSFFPLISDDICEKMNEENFNVNNLAGVVIVEAFFLKLLMDFRGGYSEKELSNWVVGSITGIRNYYFFDVLVNMLIQPKLLFHTHLLDSEQEISLRKILYDAVVLVDYSFLNNNANASLETDMAKSLAISRLHLMYEAMEFCRKNKDQKSAFSYSNAFSTSSLRLQITKWIKMVGGKDPGTGSSPKDLLTELSTKLQGGDGLFGDKLMKLCVKLAIDDKEHDSFKNILKANEDDLDDPFYISKGEERDIVLSDNESSDSDEDERTDEMTNAALINAAKSIKTVENEGKKRKGGIARERDSAKYFKYDLPISSSSDSKVTSNECSDDSESD